MPIEAREPPMSGVPTDSETVPSSESARLTAVSPPWLNQNPQEIPRPWFGPSGAA